MEDDDFLNDINKDEAAEAPEEKQPETEAKPEEPASEPETPEAEQPQSEGTVTAEQPKPEPGFVPFGAVLDERDKRKKLEAELETLRQRSQPQQPVEMPDVFDEGFVPTLTQQFEQRLYQQSLQMSERFARSQYGDEITDAAVEWARQRCDADPYFNAQIANSGDPVGQAVREYQRNQIVESVTPDDFEQFKAWKTAQAGLQQQPSAQPQSSPKPIPPKSLASAPSAGPATSEPVQTDEEMFEETFARK